MEVAAPPNARMDKVVQQVAPVRGDLPRSRSLPDLPARAARGDFQFHWLPNGDFELRIGTAHALIRRESEISMPIHIGPGANDPLTAGRASVK